MKVKFQETINKKTDKELETISKDYVFYSEEERLIALRELEVRGKLTKELSEVKRDLEFEKELSANAKRKEFENSEHRIEDQPTITLRITPFKQIRSLFFVLFFGFLVVIIIQLTDSFDLSNAPKLDLSGKIIFFTFFAAFISFFVLSVLFIHIDYFIRNRNEEYEIRDKLIIRRKNGIETYYSRKDIDDIHLYHTESEFSLPSKRPPWAHYHFVKILMKSGEVLYLTSLFYPSGLKKILDGYIKVSYLSETRWFPTTLY